MTHQSDCWAAKLNNILSQSATYSFCNLFFMILTELNVAVCSQCPDCSVHLGAFESMNLLKRKKITSMDNYKAASLSN